MSPSHAIVLAAGLGSRLQAVHAGRPKGLVEIGGVSLLARSLRQLATVGVREVVVVTGWQAPALQPLAEVTGLRVTFAHNERFATTGSLASLALGAALVRSDAWVLESDLLYEASALRTLADTAEADVVLTSGPTESGDEVWVYARRDGTLEHMSKTPLPGRTPAGELVGVSRCSRALLDRLVGAAAQLPALAHYEDGLNLAANERPIHLAHREDLVWCEIDDPRQLARARDIVWPRLAARA